MNELWRELELKADGLLVGKGRRGGVRFDRKREIAGEQGRTQREAGADQKISAIHRVDELTHEPMSHMNSASPTLLLVN